jgi:BirA family biotin operon repressor/biotin-[acetyl-CoA-carboxylase] ligase
LSSNRFKLAALRRQIRPFRLHWYSHLASTNDHAAALRRRGAIFAPAVVLASRQTRGRGRGANTWWSGEGCLTVTFVLPAADHLQPHQIPLLAGLAVRNAIQELIGTTGSDSVRLKWPNDILFDGRKLGGLLCERVRNADLIGVGVNVNVARGHFPKSIRACCVSLREICGTDTDMNAALTTIGAHVYARLSRHNDHHFGQVLREYHRHHALVGRHVEVKSVSIADAIDEKPVSGVCVGLDASGRLLLRHRSGVHRVIAGQVSVR